MDWADHIRSFIDEERRSAPDQSLPVVGNKSDQEGVVVELDDGESPRVILGDARARKATPER